MDDLKFYINGKDNIEDPLSAMKVSVWSLVLVNVSKPLSGKGN